MKFDVFPMVLMKKNYMEVSEATRLNNKDFDHRIMLINLEIEKIDKRQNNPSFERLWATDKWGGRGGVFGFILFLYCIFNVSFFSGVVAWIISYVSGWLFGYVSYKSNKENDKSKKIELQGQIVHLNNERNKKNKSIKEKADKEYNEYLNAFEKEVIDRSLVYTDSKLADQIAEWASAEIIKAIKKADRSSSEKDINVGTTLEVYNDKIKCNKKEFDFKEKRIQNIPSLIDQAAITRVIGSKINLNITMKFEMDPSGTDNTISLKYQYYDNVAVVEIVYMANNGNYIVETTW